LTFCTDFQFSAFSDLYSINFVATHHL